MGHPPPMSSDDEISKRDTKESVLDREQMEELGALPSFPDREELLKTQELDAESARSFRRNSDDSDDHSDPLDSTQIYEIPHDLLQMSMRSQEMPILQGLDEESEPQVEWREFVAVVDPRGRIVLPSRVQQDLRGKKLRVRYVVDS